MMPLKALVQYRLIDITFNSLVLLTPVPEPTTLAVFAFGVARLVHRTCVAFGPFKNILLDDVLSSNSATAGDRLRSFSYL